MGELWEFFKRYRSFSCIDGFESYPDLGYFVNAVAILHRYYGYE